MEYIDVDSLSDLPMLGMGQRYFDTIGGIKTYRCFIISEKLPEKISLIENDTVDPSCLEPIFIHKGITIRQDKYYPLPGFFIIALDEYYASLDEINFITYQRLMYIIYCIRKLLKTELTDYYTYIFYEEKNNLYCNLHLWLLPIDEAKKITHINGFDIDSYIKSVEASDNFLKITELNRKIQGLIAKEKLYKKDDDFLNLLINGYV